MPIAHLFAGVPVSDFPSARAWYERLLGRPPDLIPHAAEAAWQLTDGGWIYVVADGARAGRALLTFLVDDLDEHVAGLASRGLAPGPIETVPGVVRTAVLVDPDGNKITFGQGEG